MSLAEIWRMAPDQLRDKHMQQIISFAGSGMLRHSSTVKELRDYFACVPSSFLSRYLYEALPDPFDGDTIVLQDLINEVGRRLGFRVTSPLKKHTTPHTNYTGLWQITDGRSIITAMQRHNLPPISPSALLACKEELVQQKVIARGQSSILIVAAPGDTVNLEQQLRSSNFAVEIRLISMDALLKLMCLKEDLEEPLILRQLLELLTPRDYLKVDCLVDLLLSVVSDIPAAVPAVDFLFDDAAEAAEKEDTTIKKESKPKIPSEFREACMERLGEHLRQTFVKESRVIYTSPEGTQKIVCLTASESAGSGRFPYFWFGFRPKQKEALAKAEQAYIVFGCGSESLILLIPYAHFCNWLEGMNISGKAEKINHWHVVIYKEPGKMRLKSGQLDIDLTTYILPSKQE